jgi:hypothetical protein
MLSIEPFHGVHFVALDEATRRAFGNVTDAERLHLSADTVRELKRLSSWVRTSMNWDYPPDPGPWRQDECNRFNRAVDEVLRACRAELGAAFEIVPNIGMHAEDPDLDAYLNDPREFMSEREREQWPEVVAALQ